MSKRNIVAVVMALLLTLSVGAVAVAPVVVSSGASVDVSFDNSLFSHNTIESSYTVACGPVCPGPGTDRG